MKTGGLGEVCAASAGNGETPRPSYRIRGRSFSDAKAPQELHPAEKAANFRRHLINHVPISDICDKYQLPPSIFYAWQKLFFENGVAVFERKSGSPEQSHLRTIAVLRDKLQRKNEFVAELMEAHIQLKKS